MRLLEQSPQKYKPWLRGECVGSLSEDALNSSQLQHVGRPVRSNMRFNHLLSWTESHSGT